MANDQDGVAAFEDAMRHLAMGNLAFARASMSHAAKLHYLPGINTYAYMLEHGVGGRRSREKAIRWLKLAAERGDTAACLQLGAWYTDARHIGDAKFWLSRAGSHPRAVLLWIKLIARSRSCRATERAKRALNFTLNERGQFTPEEREDRNRLFADFRKRNPSHDPTKRARPIFPIRERLAKPPKPGLKGRHREVRLRQIGDLAFDVYHTMADVVSPTKQPSEEYVRRELAKLYGRMSAMRRSPLKPAAELEPGLGIGLEWFRPPFTGAMQNLAGQWLVEFGPAVLALSDRIAQRNGPADKRRI